MNLEELNQIRGGLKPTTTVERTIPVVDSGITPEDIRNITGVIDENEIKEYYDSEDELEAKAKEMADLIRQAKHFVVYTGAGISTAAKIPDYRGPGGVWTLRAKGLAPEMKITLDQAVPTFSHMALVTLYRKGLLKFVVSTNVDGLHRRSGLSDEAVSDLHGNIYREVCSICNAEYLRPFDVRPTKSIRIGSIVRHTGRLCERMNANGERCIGKLCDSIVNFGESLPVRALELSKQHSLKADLTLVVGSSMRVSPACELPSLSYLNRGKFCLLNLQNTPYDKVTCSSNGIRIYARCDEFFARLMRNLEIDVEEWCEDDDLLKLELENMILDPDFEQRSKYNMNSMSDDGPPPAAVLQQISNGKFRFRNHIVASESRGEVVGKVID